MTAPQPDSRTATKAARARKMSSSPLYPDSCASGFRCRDECTHTKKSNSESLDCKCQVWHEQALSQSLLQKPDRPRYSSWAIVRKPLITPEIYTPVSEVVQRIEAAI